MYCNIRERSPNHCQQNKYEPVHVSREAMKGAERYFGGKPATNMCIFSFISASDKSISPQKSGDEMIFLGHIKKRCSYHIDRLNGLQSTQMPGTPCFQMISTQWQYIQANKKRGNEQINSIWKAHLATWKRLLGSESPPRAQALRQLTIRIGRGNKRAQIQFNLRTFGIIIEKVS